MASCGPGRLRAEAASRPQGERRCPRLRAEAGGAEPPPGPWLCGLRPPLSPHRSRPLPAAQRAEGPCGRAAVGARPRGLAGRPRHAWVPRSAGAPSGNQVLLSLPAPLRGGAPGLLLRERHPRFGRKPGEKKTPSPDRAGGSRRGRDGTGRPPVPRRRGSPRPPPRSGPSPCPRALRSPPWAQRHSSGKALEPVQSVHCKAAPRAIAIDENTLEWLLHIHVSPK